MAGEGREGKHVARDKVGGRPVDVVRKKKSRLLEAQSCLFGEEPSIEGGGTPMWHVRAVKMSTSPAIKWVDAQWQSSKRDAKSTISAPPGSDITFCSPHKSQLPRKSVNLFIIFAI